MLSDEEKQAIEFLKEYQDKPPYIIWKDNMPYNKKIQSQIILNLIEKQSKEIEELKDTRSIFNMGRRSYKNEIEDKIKAKIEEVKDGTYDAKIVLQSLLEKE